VGTLHESLNHAMGPARTVRKNKKRLRLPLFFIPGSLKADVPLE